MAFVTRPVLLVAVLWVASGCAHLPGRAPEAARATAGRTERRELEVEGRRRSYLVHWPASRLGAAPLPLILMLHWHGGTARRMMRRSGLNAVADREGWMAVYPEGTSWGGTPWRSWNAGSCCGYAVQRRVDDVRFLDALISELERTQAIDPARVFLAGASNGGMMAYRAGCELTDRIAAIGVVAGAMAAPSCAPSRALPVFILHGTADRFILYEGGRSPRGGGRVDLSVAKTARFWAAHNGCAPSVHTQREGLMTLSRFEGCRDDSEVSVMTIEGGAHAWPRGQARFSVETLWTFFARHRRKDS